MRKNGIAKLSAGMELMCADYSVVSLPAMHCLLFRPHILAAYPIRAVGFLNHRIIQMLGIDIPSSAMSSCSISYRSPPVQAMAISSAPGCG